MITIAIADDHMVVRQGLKQILNEKAGFLLAGEAANGYEALSLAREKAIDVLVLDLSMPGRSGIELVAQIKSERPKLPVLVLSMHNEEQYAVRAIKAGAAGYLTKGSVSDELVDAVRKIAAGGLYITPTVAERLALEFAEATPVDRHKLLSDREYQIFELLVAGKSVTDIAATLCISGKTVSTYKTRVMQKMRMGSTAALIYYAIEHGISSPR
ncbi:MAG: response regulator transcription factor [Dechloromonas sp.]|nr:MAG: response regulator transcription factor [Dechloromonas sp.]